MNLPLLLGAFFGLTAVAAGAYANHGIDPDDVEKVMLAVRSQQIHGLVMLILGFSSYTPLPDGLRTKLKISTGLFTLGILLFAGVIFLKYFLGFTALGFLVPFGGVTIIFGWLALVWAGFAHGVKACD